MVSTSVNFADTLLPMAVTAVMQTMIISASITEYSVAVGPSSDFRNLFAVHSIAELPSGTEGLLVDANMFLNSRRPTGNFCALAKPIINHRSCKQVGPGWRKHESSLKPHRAGGGDASVADGVKLPIAAKSRRGCLEMELRVCENAANPIATACSRRCDLLSLPSQKTAWQAVALCD